MAEDFYALSSWSAKTYSWGTGKTRCYVNAVTSLSDDMLSVVVDGAVRCNTAYSLDKYGVKLTVGHNGGGGIDAESVSNLGVFYAPVKEEIEKNGSSDEGSGTEDDELFEEPLPIEDNVVIEGSGEDSSNAEKMWIARTEAQFNFPRKKYEYEVSVYTKYVGENVSVDIDGVKTQYEGCGNSGYVAVKITVPTLPIFTVDYNDNGGHGSPDSQVKYYGNDLVLSNKKPKREGHTFLGWSTDPDATVKEYAPSDVYTLDADVTLHAIWESANKSFSVMQHLNGYEIQDGGAREQIVLFEQDMETFNNSLSNVANNIEYNANSIDSIYSEITGLSERIEIIESSPESFPAIQSLAQEALDAASYAKNKIDSHMAQIQEESAVARIDGDRLVANNLSVDMSMYIGDWVIAKRANGGLSLKWIGDDA